uniref:Mediator of RNA polymerase II transcription subunit 4 n=1 Tax=Lygus hesperus TaxID=30085 RepID=A0A0A9YDK4_LYGHE
MDRITEVRRLCAKTEGELSDFKNLVLLEARGKVGQANDECRQLVLEKEKYESLKTEVERLKSRKAILAKKKRGVDDGYEELSHRLRLTQNELLNVENSNAGKKEKLKTFMMEVIEMEHDKENRMEKMKKDFDRVLKMWKIYKGYLDMRICLVKPDLYLIGFSASKSTQTSLTLRSLPDLQDWEVIKVDGVNSDLKEKLTSYLAETKDLLGVLCLARRHCRE